MPEEIWNKPASKPVQQESRHATAEASDKTKLFDATFIPYLPSAYNLARWLTRNEQDAEDIVQESFLRALRSFETFTVGRDPRAWLLTIVRNCCRTSYTQNRSHDVITGLDIDSQPSITSWSDPEAALIRKADSHLLHQTIEQLPFEYREVLILRELEELSYKEISLIIDAPIGTVMSRLSRARKQLYLRLAHPQSEGAI